MATSLGGGIAQGLESGFGLGMRLRDREDERALRERRESREGQEFAARREDRATTNKRLATQDERQARLDAIKALDEEGAGMTAEMAGLLRAAGGDASKIDPTLLEQHSTRAKEHRGRKSQLLRQQYEPLVGQMKQEAKDMWSRVEAGQVDLSEVPPDKLFQGLAVATRRDPADLMPGPNGEPSRVTVAATDIITGMKTKNEGLSLKGWNVLLEPELKIGIGQPGKDGSEIVKKEVVKIVPHPSIPGRVLPVLRVYVKRADGATGSYIAPPTKGRSSDPTDDDVTDIGIKEAMDYAGRMETLSRALADPRLRESVEEGRKSGGSAVNEFMQGFYALGGQPPKMTTRETTLGDRKLLQTMDDSGREVGREELKVGVAPRAPATTGVTGRLQAIQDYAAENGVSEEEAAKVLQGMGVIPAPRAPAAPKAPPASRAPRVTEAETAGLIRDAKKAVAGQMGLNFDSKAGKWKTRDGKPADENQVAAIEAAGAEITKRVRDAAARGEKSSATDVIKAAEGAASAAPNKKLAPASFKASGRDAKADFETVAGAIAKGANPNQLAANLAKAGYSSQSINEALAAAGVKAK